MRNRGALGLQMSCILMAAADQALKGINIGSQAPSYSPHTEGWALRLNFTICYLGQYNEMVSLAWFHSVSFLAQKRDREGKGREGIGWYI